jgi:hypothetical protein
LNIKNVAYHSVKEALASLANLANKKHSYYFKQEKPSTTTQDKIAMQEIFTKPMTQQDTQPITLPLQDEPVLLQEASMMMFASQEEAAQMTIPQQDAAQIKIEKVELLPLLTQQTQPIPQIE